MELLSTKDPASDVSIWDACLSFTGLTASPCLINIKVSDVTRPVRKNDIASVQKLMKFYEAHPSALLFYVVLMLEFQGNVIYFRKRPIVRYYPWIGDFVVNPRNHHIQSIYETSIVKRTTQDFIALVKRRAFAKHIRSD